MKSEHKLKLDVPYIYIKLASVGVTKWRIHKDYKFIGSTH